MKIKQIAVCGVANVSSTQCNAMIFALAEDGNVYVTDDQLIRRMGDEQVWWPIPQIPDEGKE